MRTRIIVCLLIIFTCSRLSHSETIDSNTTIDASNDDAFRIVSVVNGANPPTIVEILDGAELDSMGVFDSSIVNFRGGQIPTPLGSGGGGISVLDNGTLNMSGGSVGSTHVAISVFGRGHLNISGGSVSGDSDGRGIVILSGFATGEISGGEITGGSYAVELRDNAELTISGGRLGSFGGTTLQFGGQSHASILGGRLELTRPTPCEVKIRARSTFTAVNSLFRAASKPFSPTI